MTRGSQALRHAALVSVGALVLHDLRYRVGYGRHVHEAVATQGHRYLSWVAGLVIALAAAAACALVVALLRSRRRPGAPRSFAQSWLGASAGLVAIYTVQELLEGELASGHPGGLGGVVGHGGWTALLFACALGALIALASRGADQALALRPLASVRPAPARAVSGARPVPGRITAPRVPVLALNLAGRAPPASC